MDRITITGIEVFGHHGVLDHERRFGQRFVVDLALELDLSVAARTDDLADTVDYGVLSAAVAAIVGGEPLALIETVAERVAARCLDEPAVRGVEVTVHKPAAPLSVVAGDVAVTIHRSRV